MTDSLGWKERCLPDIPAGGSILKMEFLHPSRNDPDQIILVLIVSKSGKAKMLWYEWKSGMSLRQSRLKATVQPLPQDERLPLLLIPLKHFTAFMVVCEKLITLYKDLLTGTPTRYIQRLEEVKDPEGPEFTGTRPVWVQWARPMRKLTDTFTIDHDGIFLCREDGVVQYLTLLNIEHMLDTTHKAGRLGINVNTAFAILDVGPTTVDLFAAGGDMTDGGLWRSGPRVDPLHLKSIPNWTPLNEIATINAGAEPLHAVGYTPKWQQRIFACSGRGRHGAITELRYGYEAPVRLRKHDLSDEANKDILNIWAFHSFYGEAGQQQAFRERQKYQTYILVSCPMRTFLLRLPLDGRPQVVNLDLGLVYDARTIAASSTTRGLIQVTENFIRTSTLALPPSSYEQETTQNQAHFQDQDQAVKMEDQSDTNAHYEEWTTGSPYCYEFDRSKVVAACIYTTQKTTLILLAVQQGEAFHLQMGHMVVEYMPLNTTPVHSQPSTLLFRSFGDIVLALVSNLEGELLVFLTNVSGSSFDLASKYNFQGSYAICDSLAVITSSGEQVEQSRYIVVCGLRNGLVNTLCLGASPSC